MTSMNRRRRGNSGGSSPSATTAAAVTVIALFQFLLPFSFAFSPFTATTRNAAFATSTTEQWERIVRLRSAVEGFDEETSDETTVSEDKEAKERNALYINGLMVNLSTNLDKWIVSGSSTSEVNAYNILEQIKRESMDPELTINATRMMNRSGLPLHSQKPSIPSKKRPPSEKTPQQIIQEKKTLGANDMEKRRKDVRARKEFESMANDINGNLRNSIMSARTSSLKEKVTDFVNDPSRSIMSARTPAVKEKVNDFVSAKDQFSKFAPVEGGPCPSQMAEADDSTQSKTTKEEDSIKKKTNKVYEPIQRREEEQNSQEDTSQVTAGAKQASQLIAKAGAGLSFTGDKLGIGGLDEVLKQVKRRIWVPLAAPPSLLEELGINPVRGLLLYGKPGCGKTLIARTIGRILSPARPITVVSGPEVMDKFVGSSEANLRQLFDNPPDIHERFRVESYDGGDGLARAALHVIILDEFDAMARSRGGSSGAGDSQGDAGVARDSVVNQLLAKMDGVDDLCVPTLVIGLTNKRTLIEPALLRPGRFEVQIEVPPPRTVEQRVSIFDVHMKRMFWKGRVLVRDVEKGSAAGRMIEQLEDKESVLTYNQLLHHLAARCETMTGASMAGVCRAAASRALERAVYDFADYEEQNGSVNGSINPSEGATSSMEDCLVTQDDFEKAIDDVMESTTSSGQFTDSDEVVSKEESKN